MSNLTCVSVSVLCSCASSRCMWRRRRIPSGSRRRLSNWSYARWARSTFPAPIRPHLSHYLSGSIPCVSAALIPYLSPASLLHCCSLCPLAQSNFLKAPFINLEMNEMGIGCWGSPLFLSCASAYSTAAPFHKGTSSQAQPATSRRQRDAGRHLSGSSIFDNARPTCAPSQPLRRHHA